MVGAFSRKRSNLGVRYGLIAGLFFTLAAWGLDAIILTRYHASLPFLKFVPALLICVPTAILAGYLTAKTESGMVGLVIWGGLAVLFTFLVINLPLRFQPWYLNKFRPDLSSIIYFEELIGIEGYWFYCLFAIGITCLLCGFLENVLLDQGLASSSLVGPQMPFVVCALIMLLSGLFGDLLLIRDFRKPIVAYDQLLKNAATYYNKEVDNQTKRNLRLGTVDPLGDLVLQPHTLTLVEVDRYLTLTKVLIEFDDQTALCQAIQSKPTFCRIIDLTQQGSGNFRFEKMKISGIDSAIDDIIGVSIFPAPLTT
jgi:hypothetical protein